MNAVAICGDWHGDARFARKMIKTLSSRGITEILHCGDFGYGWDADYIPNIDESLNKHGMTLRWVPGNHENYDEIDLLYDHDAQRMGMNGTIYVLRRGERFMIGATSFVGIGGGHSIDKDRRTQGVSWWPQELITTGDVYRIMTTHRECDVVIAHDAPLTADLDLRNGYKDDPHSIGNRRLLGIIVDHLDPLFVFHGHYHQRHSTKDHLDRVVIGLSDNRDWFNNNFVIFDCDDKKVIE